MITKTFKLTIATDTEKQMRKEEEYLSMIYGAEEIDPEETKWIPVGERLPKEFESVLVCYKSQGGIAQAVSERLTNMDGSNRWSALAGVEPMAWMSLPEPYKAEEED